MDFQLIWITFVIVVLGACVVALFLSMISLALLYLRYLIGTLSAMRRSTRARKMYEEVTGEKIKL